MGHDLDDLAEYAVRISQDAGCTYCDARVERSSGEGLYIEDGRMVRSDLWYDSGIGIRILGLGTWGFCSLSNPGSRADVRAAVDRALCNSRAGTKSTTLADVPAYEDVARIPVRIRPDLDDLAKIGLECDKRIRAGGRIASSRVSMSYVASSGFLATSRGSKIKQSHTDTVAEMTATAHESGLTQSVNITEGGRGGTECVTERDIFEISESISKKADALLDAKPAKQDRATVLMNPDFVGLLAHELLGHPSEADRVLGKEMAWAGGAWWAGKIGERIGSSNLDVFDDPTIAGSLGHYTYDDEGVRARRTQLVKGGMLEGHLQNRETAGTFDSAPTANMRSSSYGFVPLIRMACTCIGPGEYDPDEMIREIRDGYYISNMRIPSIDMRRHDWSISCQWARRIKNGELTDLLRDVIVSGTAPEFFASIDACGRDFTVRPITNCGKGDPMQTMAMGNGGPSIRGTATVRSVGAD